MNIALISGSPRKGENSEKALTAAETFFIEKGHQVSSILLRGEGIKPCTHCNYCVKNPDCKYKDEGNEYNRMLAESDAILVYSPVYFGDITSQLKALIDRTRPLRRHGFQLKGKVGAAVTVGGSRNGGQEYAIRSIHAWMMIHGMVVVGDDNHFGGTLWSNFDEDENGRATHNATLDAVQNLLERLS